MEKISNIRKKAASDALVELTHAFRKVRDRYDRKHQLRNVLHQPRPAQSLALLAHHLQQVRDNATLVHSTLVSGSILDPRIELPIQWAEQQLLQLQTIIEEARNLALDLRAFEIDKSSLDSGAESLSSAGDDRINDATQMLAGLSKVWEEAFDLAGGICLRHEGLDEGLCQLAEALIEDTNWIKGKAFAIPGRSAIGVLPNVVHLPFTEWTIWAMPLTAHEVWHLRVRNREPGKPDKLLRAILEDAKANELPKHFLELEESAPLLWGDVDFQRCMADVFGIFALGPAYACACIDLALDPGQESSKQRALTMFHCLRADSELQTTLDILERQWHDLMGYQDYDACPVSQSPPKYERWIKAVEDYLKGHATGFVVDRWREQRGPLMDALRLSTSNDPALSFDPANGLDLNKTKLKYLISAAWKTRLEFPPETDQIAKRCKQLADYLLMTLERSTKLTAGF